MLIGVPLPLTEENIKELSGYNLMKAHDMFLGEYWRSKNDIISSSTFKDQYLICRAEIVKRLEKQE